MSLHNYILSSGHMNSCMNFISFYKTCGPYDMMLSYNIFTSGARRNFILHMRNVFRNFE